MWREKKSRKPASGSRQRWRTGSKCLTVCEKAVDGAKIADQTVREYPYQGIAIALGVGAVIGCLAAHRCSRND